MKLFKEFNLPQFYKNGYNIFFFGDLNYRITGLDNNKTLYNFDKNITDNKIIETMAKYIKQHLKDLKNNKNNSELFKNDELYKFFNNKIEELKKDIKKNGNELNIYESFKSSLEKSRTLLSAKHYHENKSTDLIEMYYNETSKLNDAKLIEYFKTEFKKNNSKKKTIQKILKPPSNPDRILYSIHKNDVIIKKNDLKMLLHPKKSDHKLVSLKVDLKY